MYITVSLWFVWVRFGSRSVNEPEIGFGFGLYSHGLFRGEQIDWCQLSPYAILIGMGMGSTPKKWGSEMKAISGGLNLVSEFNPEKLCSEMKGVSAGGVELDAGSSSTPKSEVQRWKPSMGGWTSCRSSTPKSCAQRWKVSVRGWTGCGFQFNPEKWGSEMKAINGGLNLVSEFNPEKLCLEMKGTSGGLNQDVGSSSTPKSEVQRWKPSMGGWTSGLSSTPKSCAQRWKVSAGGWTRMWVPVEYRVLWAMGSIPISEVQR